MNSQAKVGIMFVLGIVLLVVVSSLLKDGDLSFTKKKGYKLHVIFDSIAGIEPQAKVRVAGVDAGKMVKILLRDDGKVDVSLEINSDIFLRAGAVVNIKSRGLIGEKYFEIDPGSPEEPLVGNGDYIKSATGTADIDSLAIKLGGIADDVKSVTAAVQETLGTAEGKAAMQRILDNVDKLTASLQEVIEINKQSINQVMANLRSLTGNIDKMVKENQQDVRASIKNIRETSASLRTVVAGNQQKISTMLDNLATFSADLKNDFPKVSSGAQEVIKKLDVILAENREALKGGMESMKSASKRIDEMLAENRVALKGSLENLNSASKKVDEMLAENRQSIKSGIINFSSASKRVDEMLTENQESINEGLKSLRTASQKIETTMESVNKITTKVASGEGTIGKLVFDESAYNELDKGLKKIGKMFEKMDRLRLYLGARVEYLGKHEGAKTYFTVKIQPREDKFYLLEIVDNPLGDITNRTTNKKTTENGIVTETEIEEEIISDDLKYTLQLGKRYYFVSLRGGIMESSGGVGLDFYLFDDDLRLSLDAWDMTESDPHVRARLTYFFSKQVFMNIGGDDLISEERSSFFAGAGFLFGDDDLKYLLNRIPIPTN